MHAIDELRKIKSKRDGVDRIFFARIVRICSCIRQSGWAKGISGENKKIFGAI